MVSDINAGIIEEIYIPHVDRMIRDAPDWFSFEKYVRDRGIFIYSISQGLDTSTDDGRLVLGITALIAERMKAELLRKSKDGILRKVRQGYWRGKAPLGYDLVNGRLVVNEREAALVRRIFALYVAGDGMNTVAGILNGEGTPPPQAHKWWGTSVRQILQNTTYIGYTYYNRTRTVRKKGRATGYAPRPASEHIRIETPAIIDEASFHEAQRRMAGNENYKAHARRSYLLSGLVRCAFCNRRFHGRAGGFRGPDGTPSYIYYGHPEKRDMPHDCEGRGTYVRTNRLEQEVWERCVGYIRAPDSYLTQLQEQIGSKVSVEPGELARIDQELEGIATSHRRIADALGRGRMPEEVYDEQAEALNRRATALRQRRAGLVALLAQTEQPGSGLRERLAGYLDVLERGVSGDEKKAIIRDMVARIVVEKVGQEIRVEIEWK